MINTAIRLQHLIERMLEDGPVTVMLTGGRSAFKLYSEWREIEGFSGLTNVTFYFSDERVVPIDSPESNYGMVMSTLFLEGVPRDCVVKRMETEGDDLKLAAAAYDEILPESVDIMLLGVGDDGHIASLFPFSSLLYEKQHGCLPAESPYPPCDRLTITPLVINKAKNVFILAPGAIKSSLREVANEEVNDIDEMPVRIVKSGVWCHD